MSTTEYKKYLGWGHSTYKYAIDQAMKGHVKRLALFHHDPDRTDTQLTFIEKELKEKFNKPDFNLFCAYEGQEIDI
jgi:ribonuclease BN (tRNA processing enzyme)